MSIDKGIDDDAHSIVRKYKEENVNLRQEIDRITTRYQNKLGELNGLVRNMLTSVDRLVRNQSNSTFDASYSINMLDRDRKLLAEAMVKIPSSL